MIQKTDTKIQILDKTLKRGFSQIPRIVLKAQGLSLQSKTIYALLLDYAWQKGSCFPGQTRLSEDLGVHRNTVQKYLTELKDFGLVKWKRRGVNKTNVYYILPLDFLQTEQSDAQGTVHQDAQACVQEVEEDEYKKEKYKQPLTLRNHKTVNQDLVKKYQSNDNGEIKNLDSFDSEAIALAEELDDMKSIKFYQKLINRKKRGEISHEDIQTALSDTRRMIRTDQVDGTNFLRNPAGWFVSVIKKLTVKRDEEKNKEKVTSLLSDFRAKFSEKSKL